jgi:hypothetical protein
MISTFSSDSRRLSLAYVRGVLLLFLIPVVAAGCGGGSDETRTRVETGPDEQPPSKPEYIELADVICMNHQSRREDLESQASELGRIDSAAEARRIADLLREESRNLMAEHQEVGDLQLPPADLAQVASVLSGIRARARAIRDWARAYEDLDATQIRRLQVRLGVISAATEERAQAYGFDTCGR